MKKLIYADTFSVGAFHETFNASSLMMFSNIYTDIVYYAPKSSKRCVEILIGELPSNVRYRKIWFLVGKGKIGSFFRYLSSFIWNIILVLRQRHDEVLYFNYNSLWAMWLINFIVTYRKTNVIITCHGEIEYLTNGIQLNRLSQYGLKLFTKSNWVIAPTLHFCVLGESILANIPQVINTNHVKHFISYEHSFIPHEITQPENDGIYRIGTVGTIRKEKGLELLLAMGRALKAVKNVEFYALGRIACDSQQLTNAGVRYIPEAEKNYVSKELLNQYIDKMNCLIFIYPTDGYKFTASGALFDAIDREKIILSLHNDYFDSIFNIACLGKLFDTVNDLLAFLLQDGALAKLQNIDFKGNKEKFSYVGAASKFQVKLKDLSLL